MMTERFVRDDLERVDAGREVLKRHILEQVLESRRTLKLRPEDNIVMKITPALYRQLVREARALGVIGAGSDEIPKVVGITVLCEGPDTGLNDGDPFTLCYDEAAQLAYYQGKSTLFERTVRRVRITRFWKGQQYAIDEAVRLCSLCAPE